MVIWDTQQIRTRGIQLTARRVESIGYGASRDILGITTINNLIQPVPKSINESTLRSNESKSRQELERTTGKNLGEQEYQDIPSAVQNMLTVHGTSLKNIDNPGIGPQHEGLTRVLSWEKRAQNTSING